MISKTVRLFACDARGADLVEYALVTAVVDAGCAVALGTLATGIVDFFSALLDTLSADLP